MKKPGIPYRFLYIFVIFSCVLLFTQPLTAQVNREELGNLGPVEFINFEGPHSRIETRAQIRGIGYSLGQIMRGGAARTGTLGRYFVIRATGEADGFRLNADIFGLGADVAVDHIRNLRLIIQGFLEAAHQYSERDAALLAEFITIYNAVYRGDWNFFTNRYISTVTTHLSRERVGLALRFDEWPGQTLLVIPLGTGLGGALSAIDTSAVSDSRVIEQLRQEPDMGLSQRRDMVDLMEREADHAAQGAAIAREAIREEEQRIAQEQERLRQEQQQAAQERQQIAQEQERLRQEQQAAQDGQQVAQGQQPDADQQALDERQQIVEQQEEELRRLAEELEQRQQELAEQAQDAERQEVFAEQRTTEAQQERQQIAQDQQTIINREPPMVLAQGFLGISILNHDTSLGRLVLIDNTGRIVRQSPLNTVDTRTVTLMDNRIFAIAGENRGGGAIRLVEISTDTLEMQRQGDNDIAQGSLLWANGQDIFALTSSAGNLNLARFNTDLVLQSSSAINVHPHASVFYYEGVVLTQRSDGSAVLLDPRDLRER